MSRCVRSQHAVTPQARIALRSPLRQGHSVPRSAGTEADTHRKDWTASRLCSGDRPGPRPAPAAASRSTFPALSGLRCAVPDPADTQHARPEFWDRMPLLGLPTCSPHPRAVVMLPPPATRASGRSSKQRDLLSWVDEVRRRLSTVEGTLQVTKRTGLIRHVHTGFGLTLVVYRQGGVAGRDGPGAGTSAIWGVGAMGKGADVHAPGQDPAGVAIGVALDGDWLVNVGMLRAQPFCWPTVPPGRDQPSSTVTPSILEWSSGRHPRLPQRVVAVARGRGEPCARCPVCGTV
ncbi:hypothetical protein H180DRAFT_00491 [Streptomyces sp. WMMB 322]|nr:hypothetical protein H180DRAFT_00491 [Streptomyces sp. WMMB 322]